MKKSTIIISVVAIVLLLTATVLMWVFGYNGADGWDYTVYNHMLGGYWFMPFGFLGMGLFWFFVIFLIVKGVNHTKIESKQNNDALNILKNRLAKGEITEEEFDQLSEKINQA